MHAQNLVVDQRRHRQLLEDVDELLEQPTVLLILLCEGNFGLSFPLEQRLVEPVNVSQTVALVITAKQEKVLRVFDLEG